MPLLSYKNLILFCKPACPVFVGVACRLKKSFFYKSVRKSLVEPELKTNNVSASFEMIRLVLQTALNPFVVSASRIQTMALKRDFF
jgi:hypothetical protein